MKPSAMSDPYRVTGDQLSQWAAELDAFAKIIDQQEPQDERREERGAALSRPALAGTR